jgi:hypothetical protein
MNYGQLLDSYEPEKEFVYESFCRYFNNPVMTKVKDVGGYSVYMAKNHCLLTKECQYIIVCVENDNDGINQTKSLDSIQWISLQTRTIKDNHTLPSHSYQPARTGVMTSKITRTEKTPTTSTYSCKELPIIVTLLNKDNKSQYPDSGTVVTALETYKTVVTFV